MIPYTDTILQAQQAVKAFHSKILPRGIRFQDQFGKLLEEVAETLKAFNKDDQRGVQDGLGDSFYVLLGLCNIYQVDLTHLFNRIHDSNMTKTADGTLSPRGPGYRAPSLEDTDINLPAIKLEPL